MGAKFVQDGRRIDYTPATAVAAGDVVVVGQLALIADRAIAAGELGSLACEGVYDLPKAAGPGTAIQPGYGVDWDAVNGVVVSVSVTAKLGHCVRFAADSDTTVRVLLGRYISTTV